MAHLLPVDAIRFIDSSSILHDNSIPRLKRLTNSVYPSNYDLNEIVVSCTFLYFPSGMADII